MLPGLRPKEYTSQQWPSLADDGGEPFLARKRCFLKYLSGHRINGTRKQQQLVCDGRCQIGLTAGLFDKMRSGIRSQVDSNNP